MGIEHEVSQRIQNLADYHLRYTKLIGELDAVLANIGAHTIKACEFVKTGDLPKALTEIEKAEDLLL